MAYTDSDAVVDICTKRANAISEWDGLDPEDQTLARWKAIFLDMDEDCVVYLKNAPSGDPQAAGVPPPPPA